QIGLELEEDKPDLEKFEDYIFTLEDELPGIHDTLTSTNSDAKEAKGIVRKAMDKIPEAKSMTNEGDKVLSSAMGHIDKAEQLFNELEPKISEDLSVAQGVIHEINEIVEFAEEHKGIKNKLDNKIDEQIVKLDESLEQLGMVNESIIQL